MKIKEILSVLEEMAPLAYAEDFDNVGKNQSLDP
jgi:putative NIF3 family GTP cyclohydrolase 1 type 2